MWIDIDDAPFTDEEKEVIKAMGITRAEWGHPEVVLGDPVGYFERETHSLDDMKVREKSGPTTQEADPKSQPFGEPVE